MENKKILLVDDDIDFLYQNEMELKSNGYEVVTAETKQKANDILQDTKPDIAILDLMMEDMDDGFVLAYDIKKKYPDVPVIIVTAVISKTGVKFDSITDDEKQWIKADAIYTKPINTEQLIKEIERLT